MNYPVWVVPVIGSGWVIGIIAIIHIFLSHFAVGAGAFLAVTEQLAFNRSDDRLYGYLRKHSLFFLLVTTVAGAVTGVAIWWSISLVNPDGTATLIQNFTLAWALEYLFFVGELATAFAYYYLWDKVTKAQHLNLARLYFGLSVGTLVVINGILTFMLTPGRWLQTGYWLDGFLNPTYWPSLFIRLLIMFAIAGMYALVTSSRIKDLELRESMVRFCAKWLIPVFILGPICGFWYLHNIPHAAVENIFTGIQSSGIGNFSILARALYLSLILSGTIVLFAFFGPYLNPRGFTFGIALMFMVCGLTVTGATEWMRELLRKPYVVYGYMYCNGVRQSEAPKIASTGFLPSSIWAKASATKAVGAEEEGKVLFTYQCMSCHTTNGYRSMEKLLGERDQDAILGFLNVLRGTTSDKNPYLGIMPPLCTNDSETQALAKYLHTLNARARMAAL